MKNGHKNIKLHRRGYEVKIQRGTLKYYAFVPYRRPDALAEAIRLRDRFYKICGPVAYTVAKSNTDIVGITESSQWNRGREYHFLTASVGRHSQQKFFYGRTRTRSQALKAAVNYRARAIGKTPAEILPKFEL